MKKELIERIKTNFPAELLELDQWVLWRIEGRDGKPTKVPYSVNGYMAASDNPVTWSSFETVCNAFFNGNYTGVGFMFSAHDPYCGIDFDKCVTDGVIDSDKLEYINQLDSYSEISQSGTGVHTIVKATLPPGGRKNIKRNIEMYDSGRFFVVTGNHIVESPTTINDRQSQVEQFHAEIFPKKETVPVVAGATMPVDLDDQVLINKMLNASNGSAIHALWNGNTTAHNGDASAADLALCNHLAFWTGNNAARIDQLFRQSGLYRPEKWNRNARTGETYGQGTIARAINATTTTYQPHTYTNGTGNHSSTLPATISPLPETSAVYANGNGQMSHSQDEGGGDEEVKPEKAKKGVVGETTYSEQVTQVLDSLDYNFRLNLLDDTVEVNGSKLSDVVESTLATQCRDRGFKSKDAVRDVFTMLAGQNSYHPVKQYLGSLKWDGENHISKLAEHFVDDHDPIKDVTIDGEAVSTPVFRVWLGKWLIGTVAKVFSTGSIRAQPPMLVLDGEQNLGKSTFALWIGSGIPDLFIESDISPDDEDHKRYLSTKWIWEVGELGSTTNKADRDALKRFITQSEATFRIPYARHSVTKPALSSFIGTVNNESGFLSDPTGNRRFLCAHLTGISHQYQKEIDINQIWAQSYAFYQKGFDWRLTPMETATQMAINSGYMKESPYIGWILSYFDIDDKKGDWTTTTTDITAVLQSNGVTGGTKMIQMGVAEALKLLGLKQDTNARPRSWRGIQRNSF